MIDRKRLLFRWGPIPGRLSKVSYWAIIYYDNYPHRPHHYIWPESYLIFHNEKMLFINDVKKLEAVGKKVFNKIICYQRKKFWQLWTMNKNKLFLFCKNISKKYLTSLTRQEFIDHWQQFNKLGYRFWEIGILPELGAYGGAALLRNIIKKEKLTLPQEQKAISILSAPTRMSFYQEEERDLLRVMQSFKTSQFNLLLSHHQQKYYWLENSYYATKVLSKKFFLNRIKEKQRAGIKPIVALKDMQQHLKQAKRAKLHMLMKLHNKRIIKRIADNLSLSIWWQDQRKKYIFKYLHWQDLFINEFARRSKISPRAFDFAFVEEVRLNPSKRLLRLLKRRKRGYFVTHFWKNSKRLYYGAQAKSLYRQFWAKREKVVTDKLTGTVVFSAKQPIQGKVFIIRETGDIKRFPKGRILVTSMTAPEYISAIRKAKAIVTDEGGITCHAAIVARELKVPCLVGTKAATRALTNRNYIEINTTNGVIKKIVK